MNFKWEYIVSLLFFVSPSFLFTSEKVANLEIYKKDSIFNIEIEDLKNRKFKLENLKNNSLAVVVFLLSDCPLSQNYTLTLNQIQKDYELQGIKVYGIFCGKIIPIKDIQHFKQKYKLNFEVYLDKEYKLANYIGAKIAPEVFLINNQGNTIYQGAIDNWVISLGKKRKIITEHYLLNAMQVSLQNKPIQISKTEAIGCFIHNF